MPDQIHNKLGAYLDGELSQCDQIKVQAHIETCQTCRNELAELRQLSYLLCAAPQPDFTPAHDFRDQLMLQLPRQADVQPQRPNSHPLLWVVPFLVLAGWIFIQLTLEFSSLVSLANQAGILDGATAWATSNPQQMKWFAAIQTVISGVLGMDGPISLKLINNADLFAQKLVISLLWQVGLAVTYWGALTLVLQNKVKGWWTSLAMG